MVLLGSVESLRFFYRGAVKSAGERRFPTEFLLHFECRLSLQCGVTVDGTLVLMAGDRERHGLVFRPEYSQNLTIRDDRGIERHPERLGVVANRLIGWPCCRPTAVADHSVENAGDLPKHGLRMPESP